jgi:hypothetical protein
MEALLNKLRDCDGLIESICTDPDLMKVVAEGKDGRDELKRLRSAGRIVRDMRLSARIQVDKAG